MDRVLFLGQKPIGEACFGRLQKAQNNRMQVAAACTNIEDDGWWGSRGVYEACQKAGISCLSNTRRNEAALLETIQKLEINCLVSVQHPWIISDTVLAAVGYNALNLHLARLPDYKGNYIYNHAILNADTSYAITLHWMVPAVDEGQVAFEEAFPITGQDTAYSLYLKSLQAGERAFAALVQCLADGQAVPRGRVLTDGTFYSKRSLDGLRTIQNPVDADEVQRKARAFYFPPFEGAHIVCAGAKYAVAPQVDETGMLVMEP